MKFNNYIENNHKNSANDKEPNYCNNNGYALNSRDTSHRPNSHYRWYYFLETLRNNKDLKHLVVLAGILILAITIGLLMILIPLILNVINYFSQNGIQEIVDFVTGLLDKIWKGTTK
jgi:hypothetical protein